MFALGWHARSLALEPRQRPVSEIDGDVVSWLHRKLMRIGNRGFLNLSWNARRRHNRYLDFTEFGISPSSSARRLAHLTGMRKKNGACPIGGTTLRSLVAVAW